jgi:hypothetical protein
MELLLGFSALALLMTVIAINQARRDRQRKAVRPSRHRGSFQSQKGRVYSNAPSHNASPSDGT